MITTAVQAATSLVDLGGAVLLAQMKKPFALEDVMIGVTGEASVIDVTQ